MISLDTHQCNSGSELNCTMEEFIQVWMSRHHQQCWKWQIKKASTQEINSNDYFSQSITQIAPVLLPKLTLIHLRVMELYLVQVLLFKCYKQLDDLNILKQTRLLDEDEYATE